MDMRFNERNVNDNGTLKKQIAIQKNQVYLYANSSPSELDLRTGIKFFKYRSNKNVNLCLCVVLKFFFFHKVI